MTEDTFVRETSEGSQELSARGDTPAEELQREVGSVLRLPEGAVESDVKATYTDGILEVRVPVGRTPAAPSKIPVTRV